MESTIAITSRIMPATQYIGVYIDVVPYISRTPAKQLPRVKVSTDEAKVARALRPRIATETTAPASGIKNIQVIKAECTP